METVHHSVSLPGGNRKNCFRNNEMFSFTSYRAFIFSRTIEENGRTKFLERENRDSFHYINWKNMMNINK